MLPPRLQQTRPDRRKGGRSQVNRRGKAGNHCAGGGGRGPGIQHSPPAVARLSAPSETELAKRVSPRPPGIRSLRAPICLSPWDCVSAQLCIAILTDRRGHSSAGTQTAAKLASGSFERSGGSHWTAYPYREVQGGHRLGKLQWPTYLLRQSPCHPAAI